MITEQVRVQSCQNVLEKECNNANKKIEDAEAPGILVSDVPSSSLASTPAQQRDPQVPVETGGYSQQHYEGGDGAAESSVVQVNVSVTSAASEVTDDGHSSQYHGLDRVPIQLQPGSNASLQAGSWAGQELAAAERVEARRQKAEEAVASIKEEVLASSHVDLDVITSLDQEKEAVAKNEESIRDKNSQEEIRDSGNQVQVNEMEDQRRNYVEVRCHVCGKFVRLGKSMGQHLWSKHKIV